MCTRCQRKELSVSLPSTANEHGISLSLLTPYASPILGTLIKNVTGTAIARIMLEGIEYRDVHRGKRHDLRSGNHVAFAITQLASQRTTLAVEDTPSPLSCELHSLDLRPVNFKILRVLNFRYSIYNL